ncbi:MAG: peptidoglycan-associated lipoprotein, partial [Cytophagales bacterium]|nr:peptidoglycan-associated lipoprotein [Cytophagales bacterium]
VTGSSEQDDPDDLYEDIYMTTKNPQGKWSDPINLENINTDSHDASVGLSPDGQQLIVYLAEKGGGDLFYCNRNEDGSWQKPVAYPKQINNPTSNEPHATISSDGKTLYFVSNRSGGFGGFDLYKTEMNERGEWGKPVNLGEPINTSADEDAPFLDLDGKTLYFSSNGHPGLGEFDIFKASWDSETSAWAQPQNMGFPINSPSSD